MYFFRWEFGFVLLGVLQLDKASEMKTRNEILSRILFFMRRFDCLKKSLKNLGANLKLVLRFFQTFYGIPINFFPNSTLHKEPFLVPA